MEENNQRFSVGVLVLAAGIIGVLLVAYFGAVPAFWVERYRITINFRSAPKVTIDTPVRKNGVLIGRVSNVLLGPGDAGVNVTMELEKKYEIQKSEMPLITSESLITGDAVIQFVPPTPQSLLDRFDGTVGTTRDGILDEPERKAMTDIITEGYYSKGGEVAKDPMEALASIGPAFQRIDQLVLTIQDAIGGDTGPIRDLSATARTTLNNFNETVSSANRILSQVEDARIPEAVSRGLNLLPEVLKSAQNTLVQTQKTLKGFETFSSSLEGIGTEFEGIGVDVRQAVQNANTAIANIADITEPVKESSDVIVERAVRLMGNLDALAIDLKQFSTRLNSSSGTIAQLIDNPQLYHQTTETIGSIRAASANVQAITARLQPIVDDVRIFTDKIARDPGQIGVRGALSGRTLGTGLK
ncbi:MAG: MlaD family protein [Pirellula sp.]|jgi:phospholipid/cholesterol/gamma-HCH transport system substrate-binding protein|nr:MlaD family protein [Pirellula sp.]